MFISYSFFFLATLMDRFLIFDKMISNCELMIFNSLINSMGCGLSLNLIVFIYPFANISLSLCDASNSIIESPKHMIFVGIFLFIQ